MDGIHDLGGRHGFGKVEVDEPEEGFHEAWEGRVFGMVHAMSRPADWNIDWFRHCRELIEPTDYLTRPYYDQWLQAYAAMMVNSGVATVGELANGHADAPAEGLPPPLGADVVRKRKSVSKNFAGEAKAPPAFAVGDAVRVKDLSVAGHTRLPAYVRGRQGVITKYHGAHSFADASALGEERAVPIYTVAFGAAELWPEAKGRRERVFLNMWEEYLARA